MSHWNKLQARRKTNFWCVIVPRSIWLLGKTCDSQRLEVKLWPFAHVALCKPSMWDACFTHQLNLDSRRFLKRCQRMESKLIDWKRWDNVFWSMSTCVLFISSSLHELEFTWCESAIPGCYKKAILHQLHTHFGWPSFCDGITWIEEHQSSCNSLRSMCSPESWSWRPKLKLQQHRSRMRHQLPSR